MSNQSQGRKISNFSASTTLPSSAYLTYISGGVNYKIDLSSFQSALGVSGTLEQMGSATGTPVLQSIGSTNKIRNIENGPGIAATVSPQNGIKLSHNFVNGSGGVNVMINETTLQPTFRNIAAGSGINVGLGANNEIVVSASGLAASTKTVEVSSLADLPAAEAGVITLADDIDYLFVNDVTTSSRFVVNGKTTIRGVNSLSINLTYTGTGDMFTGTNCNLKIQNINIACTGSGSRVFNVSGGGVGQLQVVEARISSCYSIGVSTSMFLTRFDRVGFGNIQTGGVTFAGSHNIAFFTACYAVLNGGTMIALGSATFNNVVINKMFLLSSAGGTTFLSGLAGSANINSGGMATMIDSRTAGSATVLSGVAGDDYRWEFLGVNSIPDSIYLGMLSMQGNATATTISVATTPYLVAGTWVVEETHRTTGTTGGRVTFDADRSQDLNVTASITVAPVSGGSVNISAYYAVNGTVITNSRRSAAATSSQAASITMPWYVDFNSGDYVEIFVANDDSTTDLLVSSAVLRVG